MSARAFVVLLTLGCASAAGADSQLPPALFYDSAVWQLAFAASEITYSVTRALPTFSIGRLSSANCSPCIVLASGASQSVSLTQQLGATPLRSSSEQSYSIRRLSRAGQDTIAVLAADAVGAMYGRLDVAEAMHWGRWPGSVTPTIRPASSGVASSSISRLTPARRATPITPTQHRPNPRYVVLRLLARVSR